ncbi:MAG: hypothetical protein ABIL09_16720 [Gemmatimonadota bacterium]
MVQPSGSWGGVRRRTCRALIAAGTLAVASCGGGPDDSVVLLTYGDRALGQHVERRIRLLTAGVELRGDLAVEAVRTHALGYTFIFRRPAGLEGDIRGTRPQRDGIPLRSAGRGLKRRGGQVYELERGYCIADVFSPRDEHVASAVAPDTMSARRLLQHLGLARPFSARLDRLFLPPDEVAAWRELLPVVVQNRGFGYLYTRPRALTEAGEGAASDSVELMAQHFDLEEDDGWVLVGRTRGDQHYRHVFAPGGEYRVTALQYGGQPLQGRDLLIHLGLVPASGAAPERRQDGQAAGL